MDSSKYRLRLHYLLWVVIIVTLLFLLPAAVVTTEVFREQGFNLEYRARVNDAKARARQLVGLWECKATGVAVREDHSIVMEFRPVNPDAYRNQEQSLTIRPWHPDYGLFKLYADWAK